ncbi:MAG: phosphoglucosamine mutase, partial [Planctomycetota bacterium]
VLGGEQSGHIIDRRFGVTGDGIRTGMAVAQLIASAGRPLSELRAPIPRFPQVLLGVQVAEKVAFEEIPGLSGAVDEVEKQLDGRGRLLLRYSGTEPLARVLVEGPDPDENSALAEKVADAIRSL